MYIKTKVHIPTLAELSMILFYLVKLFNYLLWDSWPKKKKKVIWKKTLNFKYIYLSILK